MMSENGPVAVIADWFRFMTAMHDAGYGGERITYAPTWSSCFYHTVVDAEPIAFCGVPVIEDMAVSHPVRLGNLRPCPICLMKAELEAQEKCSTK